MQELWPTRAASTNSHLLPSLSEQQQLAEAAWHAAKLQPRRAMPVEAAGDPRLALPQGLGLNLNTDHPAAPAQQRVLGMHGLGCDAAANLQVLHTSPPPLLPLHTCMWVQDHTGYMILYTHIDVHACTCECACMHM